MRARVDAARSVAWKDTKGIGMAITPAEIDKITFSATKKGQQGYDTDQVDEFLERISGEVDAMLQKIADLKGRLTASEQQLASSEAEVEKLREASASRAALAAATMPAPAPVVPAVSEEQISKVLIVAQQSADQMVSDAHETAEKIRSEADQKAREVIRQALAEKQSELDEMDRLKQSREDFRDQYKALLQHFIDDADNAFSQQMLTSLPTGTSSRVPKVTVSPIDSDATALTSHQGSISGVDVDDLD